MMQLPMVPGDPAASSIAAPLALGPGLRAALLAMLGSNAAHGIGAPPHFVSAASGVPEVPTMAAATAASAAAPRARRPPAGKAKANDAPPLMSVAADGELAAAMATVAAASSASSTIAISAAASAAAAHGASEWNEGSFLRRLGRHAAPIRKVSA